MTGAATSGGSTGDSGSTGASGSGLFEPCGDDVQCANAAAECCTTSQCLDTCALPCGSGRDCPPGLVCEHGYCFATCMDDADCAAYPGFLCRHGVTLCELD